MTGSVVSRCISGRSSGSFESRADLSVILSVSDGENMPVAECLLLRSRGSAQIEEAIKSVQSRLNECMMDKWG